MKKPWKWVYAIGPNVVTFYGPSGQFVREGYVGQVASEFCRYLNSR